MVSSRDAHDGGAEAQLVAISGPLAGDVIPLSAEGVRIGRDSSNDICLPDPALSRVHCTITASNGTWRVSDSHSSNGTFVNGLQVTERDLNDGDRIGLGASEFLFVRPTHRATIPPLLEGRMEPATRLPVEETRYFRQTAESTTTRTERDLQLLLKISASLNTIKTQDELWGQLLALLSESRGAEQLTIVVVGEDGETRIVDARQLTGAPSIPVNRTVVAEALQQRAGLLTCGGDSTDSAPAGGVATAAAGSILCAPLVVRDRALGALYFSANRINAFDADDLQFATAVANLAAVALDNLRYLAWLDRERSRLQEDLDQDHNLVGRSAAMRRIYAVVAKVAQSDATVLITGETGTGKELVARAIHLNGTRAKRPFVAINCAALTESLLESELFGHERGAFTGAVTQKKGKLEVADGGTLFLDEIGELAPALQSKLLRALELGEFERVGGTRPVRVDIRLISATNRNLADEVRAGRFRADLYHRMNVINIHLPPLRERREDIATLTSHFVERLGRKSGRPLRGIAPDALKYLVEYDWPGNVRELANTIERAIVLGASDYIVPDDLPETLLQLVPSNDIDSPRFHRVVRQAKVDIIVSAFREANRSYTEAARLLGLHPNYLHRLIRNLDIKSILESER
jgi:transcriptional regulator with GAF, ATPase, and Fis domain